MKKRAAETRRRLVRMHKTGSHFGSAMSIADILTVLYFRVLRIGSPDDPGRDRFLLSKGHAASCWYATLVARGFAPPEVLEDYLADGSSLYGHPVRNGLPGIEASTGALGHGLPIGAGMALAARNDGKGYRVFVLMGDGETQEGSVWEGAMLASRLKLDNLTAIIDANNFQGFDCVENIQPISSFRPRWEAFGWAVREVDGHDHERLEEVLASVPFETGKPSLVVARTVKGKGVGDMEGKFESHYLSVPRDKIETYCREIDRAAGEEER
ncbi:MAG TPA: transketolase [bacterium]|nr:transketolase [bacterium]HPQ66582.1 transketolase [bacterium]